MDEQARRTKQFSRVSSLENLLTELNGNLVEANQRYLVDNTEKFSKIFVVGPLRSGTTLFTQWLAQTGLVAYPTNMLSRFYGAPLVGARIQQLLTDPLYNFRDEILDFNSGISFSSENGKTKGALAPNEFWYFWRRFLPFGDLDYLPSTELQEKGNLPGLRDELNALANIFGKPFAMKAMIMNQNIPDLAKQFDKALFIRIRRDPVFNIQSALEARKRQYGDINTWYSFKIKEYPKLKDLSPLESVAGQIAAIDHAVDSGVSGLPSHKKLTIQYEDFCNNPESYFQDILKKLPESDFGLNGDLCYQGEISFSNNNIWRISEYSEQEAREAHLRIKSDLVGDYS
ncbi:sulfotransferase [Alcanivorax sp. S6407]|uniref:sulfotransferase n=1 Tax=Alcanivorax sp. S6407 TaxID=2926424 RepID=UPI001FF6A127|nr:sulfotransferase [Alcanivorax sp. S6407]MCK0152856.1 sulfotransferase [Alcanivorax sp. S6407]